MWSYCTKCKTLKPIYCFGVHNSLHGNAYLNTMCKECIKKRWKEKDSIVAKEKYSRMKENVKIIKENENNIKQFVKDNPILFHFIDTELNDKNKVCVPVCLDKSDFDRLNAIQKDMEIEADPIIRTSLRSVLTMLGY
jgi:hypothetical protein